MPSLSRRAALATSLVALMPAATRAKKRYDLGATDHDICIGNTVPYSGPASAYGTTARAMRAVFDQANAAGGVNGRQIRFLSRDDGYNPAKTVEQARKLVEEDEVLLLLLAPLGTAPNSAIHQTMNRQRVPQLFVNSGAAKWDDPTRFLWTMGFTPSYVN